MLYCGMLPQENTSVSFSPDGQTLATGSEDKTIRLWDPKTGELRQTLDHADHVNHVLFSPDGKTITSASSHHTIRLWDAKTGKLQKTFSGHGIWIVGTSFAVNGTAFNPDGQTIVTWSNDQTIRLWDVSTGEVKKTLKVPKF